MNTTPKQTTIQQSSLGLWQGAVVMLVALSVISACAKPADEKIPVVPKNSKYVSMGSSFAAGPGSSPAVENTPKRCGQASENYARQLARKLNLSLTDMSCSGATSKHILGTWRELPAQIDAVDEQTRLVTIIIGGNDLGYIGGLMTMACEHYDRVSDDPDKNKCLSPFLWPTEDDYLNAEQRMNEIALAVRQKAPDTVLVFIDHAKVLPDEGGCDALPISVADVKQSLRIASRLAEITERVARDNNAYLVKTSVFSKDHHVCADSPWIYGYSSASWTMAALPYHPKREAMDAIAAALINFLETNSSQ